MSDPITIAAVQGLFEKYWKRRPLPEAEYYGVATALRVVRDRRPPPRPRPPAAVAHARQFLRAAPAMRDDLEREAAMYSYVEIGMDGSENLVIIDNDRHDRCRAALVALDEAEASMTRALDAWKNRNQLYIQDMDPARFICSRIQRAWATLGGDVPRSTNEDDPLCLFIADALALTNIRVGQGKTQGQPYTPAAISAVLSGRTERLNFIRTAEGDNCHTATYPS